MRSRILLSLLCALFMFSSCEDLFPEDVNVPLSEAEIAQGLKKALEVGTDTSVSKLNVTDGYFLDPIAKILLPPEAQVIMDKLEQIPGGEGLVNDAILSINRAAEDAAGEAKPIFVNAITSMTIEDAVGILHGEDTAATGFLRNKTYDSLQMAFTPKVQTSLDKPLILGKSTEELYTKLINTYNTASLGGLLWEEITDNTLSEYVTKRALTGLFTKVADEEQLIRKDPLHRVTDILDKVFSELDEQ